VLTVRLGGYLRVSTLDRTTVNQERELRELASRIGCEIVKVDKDHGISGPKGRDSRAPPSMRSSETPHSDRFDVVTAWSEWS